MPNASVVIEHRNREHFLGLVLSNYVFIKECANVARNWKLLNTNRWSLRELFIDDFVAQVDAFIADVHARSGDELLHLLLRLCAERALH